MNEQDVYEIITSAQTDGIDAATAALDRQTAAVEALNNAASSSGLAGANTAGQQILADPNLNGAGRNALGQFASPTPIKLDPAPAIAAVNQVKTAGTGMFDMLDQGARGVAGKIAQTILDVRQLIGAGFQQPGQLLQEFASGKVSFAAVAETAVGVAIAFVGKQSLEAAGQIEQYNVQFGILLGSAELGVQRVQYLQELALKTPFDLAALVDASRQLQVVTDGALSTGKGLQLVLDTAAATGVSLPRLADQFGKLYADMQAGRPIVGIADQFARLGIVNAQGVKDLVNIQAEIKAGTITFADAWSQTEGIFTRFTGAAEAESNTLYGQLGDIQKALFDLFAAIGAPLVGPATSGLHLLVDGLVALKDAVVGAEEFIGHLDDALVTLFGYFGQGPDVVHAFEFALLGILVFSGALGAAAGTAFSIAFKVAAFGAQLIIAFAQGLLGPAVAAAVVDGAAAGTSFAEAFAASALLAAAGIGELVGGAIGLAMAAAIPLALLAAPIVIGVLYSKLVDQTKEIQGQLQTISTETGTLISTGVLQNLETGKAALEKGLADLHGLDWAKAFDPRIAFSEKVLQDQLNLINAEIDHEAVRLHQIDEAGGLKAIVDVAPGPGLAQMSHWVEAARIAAAGPLAKLKTDFQNAIGAATAETANLTGAGAGVNAFALLGTLQSKALQNGIRSNIPGVKQAWADARTASIAELQQMLREASPQFAEFESRFRRTGPSEAVVREWANQVFGKQMAAAKKELLAQAQETGLGAAVSFAQGLRDNQGAITSAVKQLNSDFGTQLAKAKEIARLEATLASGELSKGLHDSRPVVKGDAESVVKLVTDQLKNLGVDTTKLTGSAAHNISLALKDPKVKTDTQVALDALTSQITGGLNLNLYPDGYKSATTYVSGLKDGLSGLPAEITAAMSPSVRKLVVNSPPGPDNVWYGIGDWAEKTALEYRSHMASVFADANPVAAALAGMVGEVQHATLGLPATSPQIGLGGSTGGGIHAEKLDRQISLLTKIAAQLDLHTGLLAKGASNRPAPPKSEAGVLQELRVVGTGS